MQFTIAELKEIEKVFDVIAGESTNRFIRLMTALDASHQAEAEEKKGKFFKEFSTIFDVYRTISAKAEEMQKNGQNQG